MNFNTEQDISHQLTGFLATPPLWEGDLFGIRQFEFPGFNTELNHQVLKHFASLTSTFVLGKRMEIFFRLVLKQSECHKILAHNLQILRDKITLGELDFLAEDVCAKTVFHIELVYKFYLYDPSRDEGMKRWIGPNRKDSLLQKVDKLREKQFPLLYAEETRQALLHLDCTQEKIVQRACFKANLFIPKGLNGSGFPYINNDCITGYWIHFKEFTQEAYSKHLFHSPRKPDWPVNPKYGKKWVSYPEILTEIHAFLSQKKSALLWMKKKDGNFERFFVVWW